MKASKLLGMLALAGFCGTVDTQARSHKFEIRQLEKQRAYHQEAHREAKERLSELDSLIHSRAAAAVQTENRIRPMPFKAAEIEEQVQVPDAWENEVIPVHGNWVAAEQELRNFNWNVKNPGLIREREREEARMSEAARTIAKIDKAIRKEKGRERRQSQVTNEANISREDSSVFL